MTRAASEVPTALGRHVLLDLFGCDPALLRDAAFLQDLLERAARAARATVVRSVFHRFSPQGVSGVVVIQESHLTIHTWPERGTASIDIYTSGTAAEPLLAVPVLHEGLRASSQSLQELRRGLPCP
jgi:S-adenosylmethionine decarboxylase proenzyme